jgi:hypothetical protein
MRIRRGVVTLCILFCALPLGFAADAQVRIEGVAGRDGVPIPATVFTLNDLANMPRATAAVKGRDGKERAYEGVALSELLRRAGQPLGEALGGSLLSRFVVAIAHDGYRVVFSLPELDTAMTDSRAFVADHVDGKLLAPREGPFRIVVPGEKREARWVRMVEQIQIMSAPEPMR